MIQKNFLLIAMRYLFNKHNNTAINSMVKICFIGIMIATCALALVICVMEGFEQVTYQKMQSIYPDLILDARNNHIDMPSLQPILQEQQYHIKHFSEQLTGQALLYNNEYCTTPIVIFLHGINPVAEQGVTALYSKTISPPTHNSFAEIIHDNTIFIGQKLAQNLNLSTGDTTQLLYTEDEPEQLHITFQQKPVKIGGIFKTGIDDFDNTFVYCSSVFFNTLFPDTGITQVYIKLTDNRFEQITCQNLQQRLNVDVYSWKDLYPTLVATLKLEKYVMFFILLLIIFIASMNIISLIFMYITQKKKEIALFITFGMSLHKVKMLFITMSLCISLIATISGLLLAYLIGLFMHNYPCIKLPDNAYITTHLPIQLDPTIFCAIFIASLMISLLASIISTKKLNKLNIVQTLKQE